MPAIMPKSPRMRARPDCFCFYSLSLTAPTQTRIFPRSFASLL
jgi:hypothetical protein